MSESSGDGGGSGGGGFLSGISSSFSKPGDAGLSGSGAGAVLASVCENLWNPIVLSQNSPLF